VTRILLIDDDAALSGFLQSSLEAGGQQVDYLENAQGALTQLSTANYDVILLDNRMPGLSGIELLAGLQERPVVLQFGPMDNEHLAQHTKPATLVQKNKSCVVGVADVDHQG
jgi:DNA-binding response OmpR family regulator